MWERQRGGGASAAGLDMGLVRELFQMDTRAERKKKSSLALPAPARLFVEQLHELSVLTVECIYIPVQTSGGATLCPDDSMKTWQSITCAIAVKRRVGVFYGVSVNASDPSSIAERCLPATHHR